MSKVVQSLTAKEVKIEPPLLYESERKKGRPKEAAVRVANNQQSMSRSGFLSSARTLSMPE